MTQAPPSKTLSIGVLASGQGTNLQAIIDRIGQGALKARIQVVISDNPQAFALERAKKHGIHSVLIARKNFPDKTAFEKAILGVLQENEVEWVVLAGFMRLLSPDFIRKFPHRILNIHPALLPSFPGVNAISQAYDYGVKVTGVTVHFVDEGCDTGPVIAQRSLAIDPADTLESLTEKLHEVEHQLYPEVIQWAAEGRLSVQGRKVILK